MVIEIKGVIGEEYRFIDFVTAYGTTKEPIRLLINSPGGDVNEGEKISKFIQDNAQRFLSVSNSGDVASIAASIFLSLPREKRFFNPAKGLFLIHNPFADPFSLMFTDTTAAGLQMTADQLSDTESKIAKFISKQTGSELSVVTALMSINEPLSEQQIQDLNIATIQKIQAIAYFNPKNNMNKDEVSKLIRDENESLFARFMALFNKRVKFVALLVTDAQNKILNFADVPEGSKPELGDSAKYEDGSIPSGDVVLASGETYTFDTNGVLTAITEKTVETETETETMAKQIEALKAELEQAKATGVNAAAELATAKAEMVKVKAQIKSQMTPQKPAEKPEGSTTVENRFSEMKAKFKTN